MTQGEKQKHSVWLRTAAWERVQSAYREDGCRTQNEFIERAILFYCGYLDAEKAADFLPAVLSSTLEGVLIQFGDRVGRILFKLAVEEAMMERIIASDAELSMETMDLLRKWSVQNVKKSNGQIFFRDIMRLREPES